MKKIHPKMKLLELSQHFSNYKSMGIFPDAQGQLTQSGHSSESNYVLKLATVLAVTISFVVPMIYYSITKTFLSQFTVYCFCREMRSPGGSCFPLCNLLKNSMTSGVI